MNRQELRARIRAKNCLIRVLFALLGLATVVNIVLAGVCIDAKRHEALSGKFTPDEIVPADKSIEYVYSTVVPLDLSLQHVMQDACRDNGAPYALALAVAEQESDFQLDAYNGVCYGIMQIHPINYDRLRKLGIEPTCAEGNIEAGVYMLGELLAKYPDVRQALMAYNCGESGAKRLWADGQYTSPYVDSVLKKSEKWVNATQKA